MALSRISQVVAVVFLTMACGGPDPGAETQDQPVDVSGSAGQATQPAQAGGGSAAVAGTASGGSVSQGGTANAGAPQVGSAGEMAQSVAGTGGASGGQPGGGAGGMAQAGGAGMSAGGSASSAGSAGVAQGGQTGDPLEPKPAANCPGYVDVLVPVNTCIRILGDFTMQGNACDYIDPPVRKCATVSAVHKDLVSRISSSATIERLTVDQGVCSRTCTNG